MSRFERLLAECKLLKERIKELEAKPIEQYQSTVREIQLRSLKERLTEVGRQLTYLELYKRVDHD